MLDEEAGGTTKAGSLDSVGGLLAGLTGTVIEPGVAAGNPAPASGSAPMAPGAVPSRMRT